MRTILGTIAVATLFLAAGCGDDESAGGNGGLDRLPCESDSDCAGGTCTVYGCLDTVTQMIGAAGGTVSTAGGEVTLEVPAGALSADTPITIRPLLTAKWGHGNRAEGDLAIGTAFEIANGVSFSQLATVTMSYAGLDLKGNDEATLCVLALGMATGNEVPGEDCTVSLGERTVSGDFEAGEKIIIASFPTDWDVDTRPTTIGAPNADEPPLAFNPAGIPLPVEDDFGEPGLNSKLWVQYVQHSSTLEVGDGVVRATASVDDDVKARSGLFLDYAIADAAQAMQSRVRLTGSSGEAGANRVRAVEGMAYLSTFSDDDDGLMGEMYTRITLNLDGTAGPLVLLCGDAGCGSGDVLYSDSFQTTAAMDEWHTYSLGFDPETATFYFQMDDGPVLSYEADTNAYPMHQDTWLFMATRAEARTNPGSTISIEIDRMKAGTLTDIFGALP